MINKKIAIIGAGLSGVSSVIHLLKNNNTNVSIHLFEKNKDYLFKGPAYSSNLSHQLLNVRAGQMSLYNDNPNHFFSWLNQNSYPYEISDFVPRNIYGAYIVDEFEKIVKNNSKAELQIHHTEVLQIVSHNTKFDLKITGSTSLPVFDYVILCSGNLAPQNLNGISQEILNHKDYVSNPWSGKELIQLLEKELVVILGSGLTMVDQVLSLNKLNYQGKITVISRRGLLPLEHKNTKPHQLQSIPKLENSSLQDLIRWFKLELENAAKNENNWVSVLDALRELSPKIWQHLSKEDKRSFLTHLRPFWEIHRHRVPAASSQTIQELIENGKLEVVAARINSVNLVNEKMMLELVKRHSNQSFIINADAIINCTGPNAFSKNNPLQTQLKESRFALIDDFEIGFCVNHENQLLAPNGQAHKNFFVVGPPAKGNLWETTALREIRNQATKIASFILEDSKILVV